MGNFLIGHGVGMGIAAILIDVLGGTEAQTKDQRALITQCEIKLTRDRVCVLQAVPELEIVK